MTKTDPNTERSARRLLRTTVICLAILLLIPGSREFIFEWLGVAASMFWYVIGAAFGVLIALFLFMGGTRVRRN